MRKLFPLAALVAVACAPKAENPEAAPGAAPAADVSGGGVAPMTSGAAGGMTPVTGGASVEGSGSGVNQAAMGAAQRAAAKASAGPSMGGEGGE